MNKTKITHNPCKKCGSTNVGREKTYQEYQDKVTGKIKELHTGYLYYCKDCVNRSMKAGKYKSKIWDCLDKIKEIEGEQEYKRFKDVIAERV